MKPEGLNGGDNTSDEARNPWRVPEAHLSEALCDSRCTCLKGSIKGGLTLFDINTLAMIIRVKSTSVTTLLHRIIGTLAIRTA